MPIITLTTDWGTADYYRPLVVGKIYSLLPGVMVVDITHEIQPFNLAKAGYVVQNSAFFFPPETVHLIDVRSEPSKNEHLPCIIVKHKNQYFVGEDNTIFGQICNYEKPDEVYDIKLQQATYAETFIGADLLVYAACHIASGKSIDEIGTPKDSIKETQNHLPTHNEVEIRGMVTYIDHYGNVITNISKQLFEREIRGRKFRIHCGGIEALTRIYSSYLGVSHAEFVAVFSSNGFLEIAQRGGNFSAVTRTKEKMPVTIVFM